MTSSATITPETAVRLYLQFIDDPTQLLDAAAIKQAKGAVEKAKDPIDRLRALSALEPAESTDGSVYKADFLRFARSWAEEEGVPVSAFRELGVPNDVLAEAGLAGQPKGGRHSKAGPASAAPSGNEDGADRGGHPRSL